MDRGFFFRYTNKKEQGESILSIQKKRDFLINFAYWVIIAAGVYLAFEYLLPISVPFILGILIAYLVIRISRKLRCPHRLVRIGLTVLIYGIVALLITLLVLKKRSAKAQADNA